MQSRLLFVHALSPLHAGTGQSTGAIDLPIARDRASGHPYVPGSSLKGALRDRARSIEPTERVNGIFGPETIEFAGAVVFGDANLLLLPVRSVAGTFAWVTSPLLLAKFARDCAEVRLPTLPAPTVASVERCVVAGDAALGVELNRAQRVILEDLDLIPEPQDLGPWSRFLGGHLFAGEPFWQQHLRTHLCVVHDDVMGFLSRHATDVVARNKLDDETKVVDSESGALWTEESLPVETVLVALVAANPNKRSQLTDKQIFDSLATIVGGTIQLGGKATVGRGRCRLLLAGGA